MPMNPIPPAYDDALRASETVDPRLVRYWGRLEYTPPRPTADALLVAFTAPHSIPVARDGDAAHKVEHHTWALAREFMQTFHPLASVTVAGCHLARSHSG